MAKFEFGFEELWFRLIIKKITAIPDLFAAKQVERAQQELRIGKLKVGAARIWAETAGLIKKDGKRHILTPFGAAIGTFDPDLEEDGTWWAIHYNLARLDSAAWFYAYYANSFEYDTFDRQTLETELRRFWASEHKPLTDAMYNKLIFSPLKQVFEGTRLGSRFKLLCESGPGEFARDPMGTNTMHPSIVGYCICDWAHHNERRTAHIEELLAAGAPGRILRLNRASLDDLLVEIGERYMKRVAWISHTANLNSVAISEVPALALVVSYYLELDGLQPGEALIEALQMVATGEFDTCN